MVISQGFQVEPEEPEEPMEPDEPEDPDMDEPEEMPEGSMNPPKVNPLA